MMTKIISILMICSSFAMGASSSGDAIESIVEKTFNPLTERLQMLGVAYNQQYPITCEKLKAELAELAPTALQAIVTFVSSERWQAFIACQKQFSLDQWDNHHLQSLIDAYVEGDEKLPKNIIYDNIIIHTDIKCFTTEFIEEREEDLAKQEHARSLATLKDQLLPHFPSYSEELAIDIEALCAKHVAFDKKALKQRIKDTLPHAKKAIKQAVYTEFKAQFGDVLEAQHAFSQQWGPSIDLLNQCLQNAYIELTQFVLDNHERLNAEQRKIENEKVAKEMAEHQLKWRAQCNGQTVEEYRAMLAQNAADKAETEAREAAKTPEQKAQEKLDRRRAEAQKDLEFLIRSMHFERKRAEEKQKIYEEEIGERFKDYLSDQTDQKVES